jgi:predicted nucleotidyltransferase
MMGSVAYAISSDTSDIDVYGFCIPPKQIIFPHLDGEILGFGRQHKRFEQWQQHHINDQEAEKEYDVTIYSIIKYFHLCMENNPNMIDSLFVPRRCVLHTTQIGEYLREHRKLFLHKGSWFKFKGYAYSQVNKMNTKVPESDSRRYEMVQKYGYDVKFACHVVRLLNEIEQIMTECDLDLERTREQLKSIRRGEWKKEEIIGYFARKELELETVYTNSKLPHSPDEAKIKEILLHCLEMYFGSLSNVINTNVNVETVLNDISEYVEKMRKRIG